MAVGLGLFATMGTGTSSLTTSLYMVVLGAGVGGLIETTTLIAQNSVPVRDMGAATGASTFLRNMGGSLGVSVLGAIYTSRLTEYLTSHGAGHAGASGGSSARMTPQVLKSLPEAARHLFQEAVASGIGAIFFWAAVVAAAGFVIAWFIRHVPLRGAVAASEEEAPAEVVPLPAGH